MQFRDGGVNIGAPVTVANGVATLTTSSLSAGTHTITASYSGDEWFAPSASPPLTQTVKVLTNLRATPALLSVSGAQAYLYNLTATLTRQDNGAPLPGQTIVFSTTGPTGTTPICSATTDSSGTARCNGVTAAVNVTLDQGYDATFPGTALYEASTGHGQLCDTASRVCGSQPPTSTPATST
jgi:hypothetical protein